MDSHNDLLGELAAEAAMERSDFLVESTEQLRKFLDRHRERIATIGGLTLIDEEPDYLSIAPDLTFRSRRCVGPCRSVYIETGMISYCFVFEDPVKPFPEAV